MSAGNALAALVMALLIALAGCSTQEWTLDVEIPEGPRVAAGPLLPGQSFGQTFTCKGDGLSRVEVMVATYTKTIPSGALNLHLRLTVDSDHDIASAKIPAKKIQDNTYVSLSFNPIRDSAGKAYYISLDAVGIPQGYALTVWKSDYDAYPDGSFYENRQPRVQDLSFKAFRTP